MPREPSQRRPLPSGYSLVELVASIALMGATLVPALELVRSSMETSVEMDQRQLLALYAVSQVEQQLAASAMTWANASYSGNYAADGHSAIRFDTVCSDDPAEGGVEDTLMAISTTVYYDSNGDSTLNTDELKCSYRTKVGRFATYTAGAP